MKSVYSSKPFVSIHLQKVQNRRNGMSKIFFNIFGFGIFVAFSQQEIQFLIFFNLLFLLNKFNPSTFSQPPNVLISVTLNLYIFPLFFCNEKNFQGTFVYMTEQLHREKCDLAHHENIMNVCD